MEKEVVGGVLISAATEEQKEEEWMTPEEILDGTTLNWHKKYKQAEMESKKGTRGLEA